MSGSVLLTPSAARTISFDTRPGQPPVAAWPNKDTGDQLDYWIDCSNLLVDGSDAQSAASIGAIALTTLSGDTSLVQVTAALQLGMAMYVLAGGTPGTSYELMFTVFLNGNPTRTYSKPILISITNAPQGINPLGTQASILLGGVDISQALVTADGAGGLQQALSAWCAQIAGSGTASLIATNAQNGIRTGDWNVVASGTNAETAPVLEQAISRIGSGTNGVRMPAYTDVDATPNPPPGNVIERKALNTSLVTQQFYPPIGFGWNGGTPDVPGTVDPNQIVTGYAFANGVCLFIQG